MTWHFLRTKKYSWNLLASIIIIFTFGLVFSYYNVKKERVNLESSLLEKTKIISSILDIDDISTLEGSMNDINKPEYKAIKDRLMKLSDINPDVKFIYLAGYKNNNVFFYADSEPENSQNYSPPGQVYVEASDIFKSIFQDKQSRIEGPLSDRWGSWISAFSPITDANNNILAVIGIDINSNYYYRELFVYGSIPLLIALLISTFIYFIYRMHVKEDSLLALKSELVSIAAHDLRTPLVGLKWSLDTIVDSKNENLNEDQRKTFKLMQSTSTTLLETANQILETSRIEKQDEKSLDLEKNNILDILNEIKTLYLFSTKEKEIEIRIDNDFPRDLEILCDKVKIKRVFSNLISNAIKYSPKGKEIIFNYADNVKYSVISISDQGIGIAEKDFKNIFKEYYRTDNAYEMSYGTGLGLYYVKRVIELHGGRVSFISKEGIGTTFIVELPKR